MKHLKLLAKRSGLLLASFCGTSLALADHKSTSVWNHSLWENSALGYLCFFVVTGVCYAAMVWEPKRGQNKLPVRHDHKRK